MTAMRWVVVLAGLALGCPTPAQYTAVRPGLSCERATRVAYRTLVALGYTVTDVVVASPERTGAVTGTKTDPDGTARTGRVSVTCDAKGAVLRPIEDAIFPDFDFSRAFVYSFSTLVNRPDVEEPRAALGLQILVHAIGPQEATLDLGGVPTTGGAVPVRVTIRNNTDHAVAFDPARLELADGEATPPLTAPGLANAQASRPAGERLH